MKKLNYPLLYYQLNEEAVLGILVGTGIQLVEKDLKTVKIGLSDYLQRKYKKDDYYPDVEIVDPKLKIMEVKVRPTYKETTGHYPTKELLIVPIAVVYGATAHGYYECFLPAFDESFYYYDPKQFRSLVQHIAIDLLNQLSPEQIHRQLMPDVPKMDSVSLRINEDREFAYSDAPNRRRFPTLQKLAVPFPPTSGQKKHPNALPDAAWELEPVVAQIIEKVMVNQANILLVGNHGVGKSAALKQALKKINSDFKKSHHSLKFWQLMPQRITAGSKYLGEWQETCEQMVEELRSASGVLWTLDVVRLLQIGGAGPEDSVAAFLMSFLQSGIFKMIGEVTEQELESMRRMLPGFVENFQIVKVTELSEKKVHAVIDRFAEYTAKNLKITFQQDALALSYRLLLRYYPYESFPGKAIKFFEKCLAEAQLNSTNKIGKEQVIDNFVKQTGLPELFLRDDMLLDIEDLKQHFNTRIIGQPASVDKLSAIVKIFKAGLNNPYKPIQTLVFAGPTGVGKTASARALADYFFGKGQKKTPLIRIDMSEFQHPSQITRFIGAGNEVGKLVQDIRDRPFSVLLLDEVEKADRSIFDALMTVLDEGLLVDAFGRVTNFRNTIIIMTTNLGASNRKSIGFDNKEGEEAAYFAAINSFFRPEFVNRIDGLIFFNSLKAADIRKICFKELEELKKREGFVKRNLTIDFHESVIDRLASIGFDERYGARPLQRALEQEVVNPLANWLLEYPALEGKNLKVEFVGNELKVRG